MSDDEFAELKKKKKKSKKVDFDAFEEDGASAGKDGVAAATEKIEDLDRTCFVFFSRFGFFFVFFFLHPLLPLLLTQQQFSFGEKRW